MKPIRTLLLVFFALNALLNYGQRRTKEKLNISIFLDLSDRIDPDKYPNGAMEFYQRDIEYLTLIAKTFENHVRSKRSRTIDDKIQVFLDPIPQNKSLNEKISSLKIHFNRHNATRDAISQTSKKYKETSAAIYKSAITNKHYLGSDLWGFFKNKLKSYCIEEGYRNVLIIITDGYIYHKQNIRREKGKTTYLTPQMIKKTRLRNSRWKERIQNHQLGFLPATDGLENIEVLVLGINPDPKNPYEEDVIRTYWQQWLEEMGVKQYQLKRTDLPTHMKQIIERFIRNKKK